MRTLQPLANLYAIANQLAASASVTANYTDATITASFSAPAQAWLEWGTSPSYGNRLVLPQHQAELPTHTFALGGLAEGATYYYRINGQHDWLIASTSGSFMTQIAPPAVYGTTNGAVNTSGTTTTVTYPSGLQAGDYLLVGIAINHANQQSMTPPSGFTNLGSNNGRYWTFGKALTATETSGNFVCSATPTGGGWVCLAVRGSRAVIRDTSAHNDSGGAVPAITTTAAPELVVVTANASTSTGGTATANFPSGVTKRVERLSSWSVAFGTYTLTTIVSSYSPGGVTWTPSSGSVNNAGTGQVALKYS